DPKSRRLLPHKPVELRHALLETAKDHVGAVARPWRRQRRDRAWLIGVLRALPRIAEHELARADEILAGESLIGCDAGAGGARQSADARLRDTVDKTEMLAVSLSARPHRPNRRIDDPDRRLQPPAQKIAVIRHERRVRTG